MNTIWKKIRPHFRNVYRIMSGANGFIYDFNRFLKHGGWRSDMSDCQQRNYQIMVFYHGLEKSLSYKKRNPQSGWNYAFEILNLLKIANHHRNIGYHDKAAKQVLEKFIQLPENISSDKAQIIQKELENFDFYSSEEHGVKKLTLEDFRKGILNNPEDFFFSRHSLREFRNEPIEDAVIERAIKLAMKSPSVCNRHAWHIYQAGNDEIKSKILKYQSGNRPFGVNIPTLLVITVDLKAFITGIEHYQHWIDGGIFAMSLIYAFHSLGVASCSLNWSQSPKNDKLLRDIIDIKQNHTIIMMLAIGYPDLDNNVCVSNRRPIADIYSILTKK